MPDSSIAAQECKASKCEQRLIEQYPGRDTNLGPLKILRALPIKGKRMVGPWCFLDRYGPLTFREGKPMDVAPHPHIGWQTVTWLLSGEILHNDSLGCESLLRPGVNVMTSGDGIAHAEETPRVNSAILDGVQLWVALPDAHRTTAPVFQAVEQAPAKDWREGIAHVFAGTLGGVTSPARHFSEIVGADITTIARGNIKLKRETGVRPAISAILLDAQN